MKFSALFIALVVALIAVAPTSHHRPPSLFVAADLVQVGLKSGMGADYIVRPAHAASWAPMETEAPAVPAPAPAPAAPAGGGAGIGPGSSIVVLQGGTVVGPGGVVAVPQQQQQQKQQQQPIPVQQPVPAVQLASVGAVSSAQPQSAAAAGAAAAPSAAGNSASSAFASAPSAPSVAAPAMAYILEEHGLPSPQGFGAAAVPVAASAAPTTGAEQGEERPGFGFGAAVPPAATFVAPADTYAAGIPSAYYYGGPGIRAAATVPAQQQQPPAAAVIPNAAGPIVAVASTLQQASPLPAPAPAPESKEAPKAKPKPLLRPSLGAFKQFKNKTEVEKKEVTTRRPLGEVLEEMTRNGTLKRREPLASEAKPDYSKHAFGSVPIDAKEFSLFMFALGITILLCAVLVWQLVAMVRERKEQTRLSERVERGEGGGDDAAGEKTITGGQDNKKKGTSETAHGLSREWMEIRSMV